MVPKLLIAGFLFAHGAIHASFLSPRPPATATGPQWPFEIARSPLLTPLGIGSAELRLVGLALVATTVAGFALAAVASLGLVPAGLWPVGVGLGSIASIVLLAIFFHPWLVLGVVIDVALLWAVLANGWAPDGLAR